MLFAAVWSNGTRLSFPSNVNDDPVHTMTTVTIIIQNAPYKSDNKVWDALRLAGAALTVDMTVPVPVLDDGVKVGRRGQVVVRSKNSCDLTVVIF
jgi:hypothetical protein